MHPCRLLVAPLAAAIIALPTAQAALIERNETHPAVQVCQAALPVYDGNIRKRPRAMQNEGTTTAFVTCGFEGRGGYRSVGPYAKTLNLYFINNGSTGQTVSCTAVDAINSNVTATSSRYVPPGNPQSIQFSSTTINPPTNTWLIPAVSCALPPGTGIEHIWYGFVEDNGV